MAAGQLQFNLASLRCNRANDRLGGPIDGPAEITAPSEDADGVTDSSTDERRC
jgi:hypothetical protein